MQKAADMAMCNCVSQGGAICRLQLILDFIAFLLLYSKYDETSIENYLAKSYSTIGIFNSHK